MSKRFNNIVVGYNGFERNEPIAALALCLAEEHSAHLHLVHVVPKAPYRIWKLPGASVEELYTALVHQRREQLESLAIKARTRGINTDASVRIGTPHVEIIRRAMAVNADLVIVSDKPTRRNNRGFGSVTTKLLRECPYPVLAKRDPRKFKHRSILAAVDVEPSPSSHLPPNRLIVEVAASVAQQDHSKVTVFHCWLLWGELMLRQSEGTSPEELQALLDTEKQMRARELDLLIDSCELSGVQVERALLKGQVRDLLPQYVIDNKIDLVVMGTVSRKGLPRLLIGNTAEKLINEVTCSVLAVKPEGFVSPIKADDDQGAQDEH